MNKISLLFFIFVSLSIVAQKTDFDTRPTNIIPVDLGNNANVVLNKSLTCSNSPTQTVPLLSCADIGTASYNTNSITSTTNYSGAASTAPASSPTCWDGTEQYGDWTVYDLDSGVTSISVEVNSFGTISTTDVFWLTFYQGPDCSSLTQLSCDVILEKLSGSWFSSQIIIDGLDSTQNLWIYSSSDDLYNLDIDIRGMTTPVNEACATATSESTGCNVGAVGDTVWSGPSLTGVMCAGTNCNHILRLSDFYSDGWDNGAHVSVYYDGVFIASYSPTPGLASEDFVLTPGLNQYVEIVYTPGSPSTFDNENSYDVYDPAGTLIASDPDLSTYSTPEAAFYEQCTQTWYSNENTVYYSFTATAASATLEVQNVICNDGTTGEAQFGVWQNCADIGDYSGSSSFVGCAVGTGTLSMPTLTVGQTYILAVDGQSGDICKWDFVSTGIALPTELINLNAESLSGYNRVYWSTASETNSDYFLVEKSTDGYNFEPIGKVKAAGNSQDIIDYSFEDYDQRNETVYYRLKQVDMNGEFEYHGPRPLNYVGKDILTVSPNPVRNAGTINYAFKANVKYSISIVDISGRTVVEKTMSNANSSSSILLDTKGIEKGMYTVRVVDESGKIAQTNFLKQ